MPRDIVCPTAQAHWSHCNRACKALAHRCFLHFNLDHSLGLVNDIVSDQPCTRSHDGSSLDLHMFDVVGHSFVWAFTHLVSDTLVI